MRTHQQIADELVRIEMDRRERVRDATKPIWDEAKASIDQLQEECSAVGHIFGKPRAGFAGIAADGGMCIVCGWYVE